MARFPKTEAEVAALGQELADGLAAHAGDFPAPPVSAAALRGMLDAYLDARNAVVAAAAAYAQAVGAKNAALQTLKAGMRKDLRYAEYSTDWDPARLRLVGWGAHAAPTPLAVPGQPRALVAVEQGEDWLRLRWKAPTDGGPVAAYTIERRERPGGAWETVDTTVRPGAMLPGQPRGKDLEYRVVAVNRAGPGEPGNTVMAVL